VVTGPPLVMLIQNLSRTAGPVEHFVRQWREGIAMKEDETNGREACCRHHGCGCRPPNGGLTWMYIVFIAVLLIGVNLSSLFR